MNTTIKPWFTGAALENIAETGIDPQDDLAAVSAGSMTPEQLLEHCLDGADEDRRQGWLWPWRTVQPVSPRRVLSRPSAHPCCENRRS